ncbi:MAG: cytochrome c biogenesis protein CcsA [Myxococcales bacterium]|nr:cytochrome c biogenesis protein CcsA [Myxococcales bacterium]
MSASVSQGLASPLSVRPTGWVLAIFVALYAWLVTIAPIDSVQGLIQKILYVHVPCAFAAYLGFVVTAVSGGLYLWKSDLRFDRVAAAGAEVGVLFCSLMITSGPIWAKGTWGHWWVWDARLTITLMLWFVFLAYLLLRSFTEGSERAARFSAVYGIVGALLIPLNYYAIELFGNAAMHPDNLERDSLGTGMGWPFLVSILTASAAFFHLLVLRIDLAKRRSSLEQFAEDL